MEFQYFKDPINFSFLMNDESKCPLCNEVGLCFDAGSFVGENDIECICPKCLAEGKLIELDIQTNDVNLEHVSEAISDTKEFDDLTNTIVYMTPKLPTWQEIFWPFEDGKFLTFEKIASKLDFDNDKEMFKSCFSKEDQESIDLNWLWDVLPDHEIKNLEQGNYDISVYLFSNGNKKYCIFDAN